MVWIAPACKCSYVQETLLPQRREESLGRQYTLVKLPTHIIV
jgi:hypothetical protein